MPHYPLEKCDAEDDNCCALCRTTGTIFYKAVSGTEYCSRHGGANQLNAQKREQVSQYRLLVWQNRLKEFTGHDDVKSLRDEIGILRIVLEETLNRCTDRTDLLLYSAKISDLAVKIEKLVTSCDRLEKNMGQMMDRPTALRFAAKLVEIVGRHIIDPEQLDAISSEVLEELRQ